MLHGKARWRESDAMHRLRQSVQVSLLDDGVVNTIGSVSATRSVRTYLDQTLRQHASLVAAIGFGREMHHRLANSLTVLTSMLRREFAQLLLPAKCSLPVCFGWFMALLDIQIVASSLQNIGGGLSAAQVEISWIQTAYRVG
jgi:hypothetical protein